MPRPFKRIGGPGGGNVERLFTPPRAGRIGDSRINIGGLTSNVAVLINGIPVNDMENGWVYWSDWAGLDAVNFMQVQRLGTQWPSTPWVAH